MDEARAQRKADLEAGGLASAKASIRVLFMRLLVCEESELPVVTGAITAAGGWPDVAILADRWRVFPSLFARIPAGLAGFPAGEADALARKTSIQFFRTTICLRAGCDALRTLTQAGIPAVAFKGAAVIAYLHESPKNRMIQDVDLLIPPRDLEESLRILEAAGFTRCISEGTVEELASFVAHSPGAAGNHAISLSNRQDAQLDLHWRLGGFDADALIRSALPIPVLQTSIPVVRPAIGLLLTVHHALRNDLVPDEIARDVVDCGGWLRLLAEDSEEMKYACALAREQGLFEVLGAMAIVLRRLGGGAPLFPENGREASTLADLYLRQLEDGPINTDLAYLWSSRALGQIFTGLWHGWGRYRGLMRAFEVRQGDPTRSLLQRGMRLLRSIIELSPKHGRQVMTLARCKDRVSA